MKKSDGRNPALALILLTIVVMLMLLVKIGGNMLSPSSSTGKKYRNPKVADVVIDGTVYDRNESILAVEVAVYSVSVDASTQESADLAARTAAAWTDTTPSEVLAKINAAPNRNSVAIIEGISSYDIDKIREAFNRSGLRFSVSKTYEREYTSDHARLLISFCEKAAGSRLSPKPGTNESMTYGEDVHLTLDIDLQYMLDYRLDRMNTAVRHCVITDSATGNVLAAWTRDKEEVSLPSGTQVFNDSSLQAQLESFLTPADFQSRTCASYTIWTSPFDDEVVSQEAAMALGDVHLL